MDAKMTKGFRHRMAESFQKRALQLDKAAQRMDTAIDCNQREAVYEALSDLAKWVEALGKDLREASILLYQDLQNAGYVPSEIPYPVSRETEVAWVDGCLCLTFSEMLPYPVSGPVHYLHEQVEQALEVFIREYEPPVPLYDERCAVVFLHHYESSRQALRHLRDYDNVEHRCITNVIASKALWGDNPRCMIQMDVLAPGDHNYTEVRVMPLSKFQEFAMSEEIGYLP